MPWWQMWISLHFPDKGGGHNMSNTLPNEYSPNWDSYFLAFRFYVYINKLQFLNQFHDTFQGKTPLQEQQFLKTWVPTGMSYSTGINENTDKQVFPRILPDVQNKFIHSKGKLVFILNPYIIHPVTKIFKCLRQPQSELLLIFQLKAPKANHSYS